MVRKGSSIPGTKSKKGTATIAVILALLSVLLFAQLISAAQGDDKPTPPAGAAQEASPFAGILPTTEELLITPESVERYVTAHTLPAGLLAAAELEDSTKSASAEFVSPNSVFQYTISVVNSGDTDVPVEVTDTLPDEVAYSSHQCPPLITTSCGYDSGEVTWSGTVPGGDTVEITIVVTMDGDAEPGTTVTNTAEITSPDQSFDRSAEVEVADLSSSLIQYAPFTVYGLQYEPGPVTLTAGRVTGANSWTLNWTESPNATGYEIHEATDPNFANATPYFVDGANTREFSKSPSPSNVFYYRVRSLVGMKLGPWSNVVMVVGAYRDDFEDDTTGWSMRRSTYREKVFGFYENGKYVMQVLDRWDWGLSSPLKPAPRVPYVIDFEARLVAPANLLSFGMVFGGDWNGQTCPPGISYDEWYKHGNCFNHFYNTNSIFFGGMKLLFERVDTLVWVPDAGGSPMKRIGDIDVNNVTNYQGIDPEGWNRYRIEVRADSIKVFAAERDEVPTLQFEYNDTRWVNDPYFGFFASTDEYNNSTWRFEYLEIMPID